MLFWVLDAFLVGDVLALEKHLLSGEALSRGQGDCDTPSQPLNILKTPDLGFQERCGDLFRVENKNLIGYFFWTVL